MDITCETFAAGDKEVSLIKQGDVYYAAHTAFCESLEIKKRQTAAKNVMTPALLKQMKELEICGPTARNVVALSLQDLVNLYRDVDIVKVLAHRHFPDMLDVAPSPLKRNREEYGDDIRTIVRETMHEEYRKSYEATHAKEWRVEWEKKQKSDEYRDKMLEELGLKEFYEKIKKI